MDEIAGARPQALEFAPRPGAQQRALEIRAAFFALEIGHRSDALDLLAVYAKAGSVFIHPDGLHARSRRRLDDDLDVVVVAFCAPRVQDGRVCSSHQFSYALSGRRGN